MLQMSDKFENDTVGNNLSLFPLVVITFADSGEKLYISTNNVSFDDNYYKPILLNVPNVKESIDLENRKYKISNANLSINNFPVSGEVFSDSLLDSSGNYIINAEVDIYWKSQSCVVLDDCLHIYHGVVRRVKHDTDKVTLSVEDLSQKELHKDLPLTYLPDDGTVLDKYKNKPIPMVYGEVDRSPCVIAMQEQTSEDDPVFKTCYIDTKNCLQLLTSSESIGIYTFDRSGVYVYDEDYLNVNYLSQNGLNNWDESPTHNELYFSMSGNNDISQGEVASTIIRKHRGLFEHDADYGTQSTWTGWDGHVSQLYDNNANTYIGFSGTQWDDNNSYAIFHMGLEETSCFGYCDTYAIIKVVNDGGNYWFLNATGDIPLKEIDGDAIPRASFDNFTTGTRYDYPLTSWTSPSQQSRFYLGWGKIYDDWGFDDNESVSIDLKFHEAHIFHILYTDKLSNKDFYANVKGRVGVAKYTEDVYE